MNDNEDARSVETIKRLCEQLKDAGSGPDVTGPWVNNPRNVNDLRRVRFSCALGKLADSRYPLDQAASFIGGTRHDFTGSSALNWAAANGRVAAVDALIDCGASVGHLDAVSRGICTLKLAPCCRKLLDPQSACRQVGWSALHAACACAHDAAALRLLDRGADASFTNNSVCSSLRPSHPGCAGLASAESAPPHRR